MFLKNQVAVASAFAATVEKVIYPVLVSVSVTSITCSSRSSVPVVSSSKAVASSTASIAYNITYPRINATAAFSTIFNKLNASVSSGYFATVLSQQAVTYHVSFLGNVSVSKTIQITGAVNTYAPTLKLASSSITSSSNFIGPLPLTTFIAVIILVISVAFFGIYFLYSSTKSSQSPKERSSQESDTVGRNNLTDVLPNARRRLPRPSNVDYDDVYERTSGPPVTENPMTATGRIRIDTARNYRIDRREREVSHVGTRRLPSPVSGNFLMSLAMGYRERSSFDETDGFEDEEDEEGGNNIDDAEEDDDEEDDDEYDDDDPDIVTLSPRIVPMNRRL